MNAILIRDAEEKDAEALAGLSAQLGYPVKAEEIGARLPRRDDDREGRVFVAETEEKVVGWTSAHIADHFYVPRTVEISGLVVDADYRGRGIGAALLGEVESWAKAKGIATVRLRTNIVREDAHRFYFRHGYEKVKTQFLLQKRTE